MTGRTHILTLAIALAAALVLAPGAFAAKRKIETIRAFSKPVSFTYTSVDGTVTQGPPAAPPRAGDVFEIDSMDFRGNHRRHAKRSTMSSYLRCTFLPSLEPDCYGYVAIGGSRAAIPQVRPHRRHRPLSGRHRQDDQEPGGPRRLGLRDPRQAAMTFRPGCGHIPV
jgi:hypothetical protein